METITQIFGSSAAWLLTPLGFLFVLTIVVFFHELGHFVVARWCGVTVKAFSIGFGPEIFGFTDSKGTRWRLCWIPLGGYVKFIDDDNAASTSGKTLKRLTPEEREGSFRDKSVGARAAVVAAGPIANFLLAIAIFTFIFSVFGQQITAGQGRFDQPRQRCGARWLPARRSHSQHRWRSRSRASATCSAS